VQPFESEITHAISSEPPTHCATVVPVPIQRVKMSSKPFSWLFDVIVGQHERNWREFSVAGFIFTYARKYFSVFLTGGGGDRPRRPLPYGSATGVMEPRERLNAMLSARWLTLITTAHRWNHRRNRSMGPTRAGRVPPTFGRSREPSVFGPLRLLQLAVILAVHCGRLTVLPRRPSRI